MASQALSALCVHATMCGPSPVDVHTAIGRLEIEWVDAMGAFFPPCRGTVTVSVVFCCVCSLCASCLPSTMRSMTPAPTETCPCHRFVAHTRPSMPGMEGKASCPLASPLHRGICHRPWWGEGCLSLSSMAILSAHRQFSKGVSLTWLDSGLKPWGEM